MENEGCFYCIHQCVTNNKYNRVETSCQLGIVALNECLGDIDNHFIPLDSDYRREEMFIEND